MSYTAPAQNPYDPSVTDLEPETLQLEEIIRRAVQAGASNLRVCLPVKVVQVNGNQNVDLQVLLQSRMIDNTVVTLPIIKNALVSMPSGVNYGVKFPIAVGDTGLALFSDRSLDAWSQGTGDVTDPQDTRLHSLSDAIYLPGLLPLSKQTSDSTTDYTVTNGKAVLKIQQAGTFLLKNDKQELFDLLTQMISNQVDLMNTLATNCFTLTMLGPQPFIASTVAAIQQLQNTAKTIQQNLATLKGS